MDNLNYEAYASQIGTKFQLPEKNIELELVEVTKKQSTPQQEMFSLIFRGATDNFLEQKIYRLHHEVFGDGELFLVPVALEADGYRYEAGFNRLLENNSVTGG